MQHYGPCRANILLFASTKHWTFTSYYHSTYKLTPSHLSQASTYTIKAYMNALQFAYHALKVFLATHIYGSHL